MSSGTLPRPVLGQEVSDSTQERRRGRSYAERWNEENPTNLASKPLSARNDITHVFLVTDSEDAFQEMSAQLVYPNVIQLYRDYLENFAFNLGETA